MAYRAKPGNAENYNRIFILGGRDCSDDDLRTLFEKFGEVRDIHIIRDKNTNENKGLVCSVSLFHDNTDRIDAIPSSTAPLLQHRMALCRHAYMMKKTGCITANLHLVKGISYVTFSKASEAALAIEEMNGQFIGDSSKPVKVILANDRSEGCVRDPKEDEKMKRLFIMVPTGFTEKEVENDFKQFGEVEYVRLLKQKGTKDVQLGYVKFLRSYHAALALEGCDAHYKPVFAATTKSSSSAPRRSRSEERRMESHGGGYGGSRSDRYPDARMPDSRYGYGETPMDMLQSYSHQGNMYLQAAFMSPITAEQAYKLFDLVPNMESCNYDPNTGTTFIKYYTPQSAAYAKDKLDGFEYPPGYHMSVRYYENKAMVGAGRFDSYSMATDSLKQSMYAASHGSSDIQTLVSTIEKATALLQQAGIASNAGQIYPSGGGDTSYRYTNVQLPPVKPMLPKETPVVERLFIVSAPDIIPEHALTDIFCRFGNLIGLHYVPGKKFGYVKFGNVESAHTAIEVMHGQTVCGCHLKVILADPPNKSGSGSKRAHGSFGADEDVGGVKQMRSN